MYAIGFAPKPAALARIALNRPLRSPSQDSVEAGGGHCYAIGTREFFDAELQHLGKSLKESAKKPKD